MGKLRASLSSIAFPAGISHSIAGIGLNLNQKVFPDFPKPASSLFLGDRYEDFPPREVAEDLMKRFPTKYQKLKEGKGQCLEQEYLESLFRLGEASIFGAKGESFEGIIRGCEPLRRTPGGKPGKGMGLCPWRNHLERGF